MWLLKFHAAFSILCTLTFWGFFVTFKVLGVKPKVKTDSKTDGKKHTVFDVIVFYALVQIMLFVPLLNIIIPSALLISHSESATELLDKKL
ncbi:MAG: hypothetical protein J6X53_05390 [Abditibacteriota bacterium]|nr:hypothetical protein [Abditibacteriota bacterium]